MERSKDLILSRAKLQQKRSNCVQEIKDLDKQINDFDDLIYKYCPHSFSKHKETGLYGARYKLCDHCKLRERI